MSCVTKSEPRESFGRRIHVENGNEKSSKLSNRRDTILPSIRKIGLVISEKECAYRVVYHVEMAGRAMEPCVAERGVLEWRFTIHKRCIANGAQGSGPTQL